MSRKITLKLGDSIVHGELVNEYSDQWYVIPTGATMTNVFDSADWEEVPQPFEFPTKRSAIVAAGKYRYALDGGFWISLSSSSTFTEHELRARYNEFSVIFPGEDA